jgi:ketosteroid isomerase-like protein
VPIPLFPVALALAAATATGPDAHPSLVEAERGFARMSVEQGMREAFLANLADDAVVFQPLPVNGQRVWSARPRSAARLMWEPSFAEIAASGDLGYTTGPWEFHPPAGAKDSTRFYGHFVSVWRRAPSGAWKVVVDLGASHERAEPGVGSGAFTAGPAHGPAPGEDRRATATQELRAAERSFAKVASEAGFATAFAGHAASDARFNRDGMIPAVGLDAARAAVAADTARARWTAQGVGASRAGDLAYAYGVRERLAAAGAPADTSVFLDVWRRESGGRWRLVMAVDNPVARRGRP